MDEALPAEAGIDAHHQNQVDEVHQIVEHFDRRARIEHDARFPAQTANRLERAVDMGPRFRVDSNDIRPGLGKRFQIRVDRRDHQMDVERLVGVRPQGFDHRRADRDIRDVMPVHHVDMDPVRARSVDRAHLFAKPCEVGGKDGGGNERRGHGELGQTVFDRSGDPAKGPITPDTRACALDRGARRQTTSAVRPLSTEQHHPQEGCSGGKFSPNSAPEHYCRAISSA